MPQESKPVKSRSTRVQKGPRLSGGRVAKGLWPRVAELRAEGLNGTQIAADIGRLPSAVARTLKEPEVIADIERIQRDRRGALDQDIRAAAGMAWAVLVELAGDESQGGTVRRAAACDILDRAGITAKTAIELSGPGGGPIQLDPRALLAMTPEQLRAAAAVAVADQEPEGDE